MVIEYSLAKNNLKTFQINNCFFHSSYAPDKEAQRFVSGISLPYNPTFIFIVEPGLNYCEPYFKELFPDTKIINIRLISDFYNTKDSINYENLEKELYAKFTSEELLNSFMFIWPAAEKIFPDEAKAIYQIYKTHLEARKTELISRQYFEKKWFINSVSFFKYCRQICLLKHTDKPVLVIASGPSLKDSLENIKKNQGKFIIIGLSSAINVLLKNNIKPDFCVSTDGGFWATRHLVPLARQNIPIAVSSESAVQKTILENNTIIPLGYNDGLSGLLFKTLDFPYIHAERNPTVSGTALILARQLTTGKVYFAGLDLCCQKGFSHTQPNIIELDNSLKDNRVKNVYTRAISGEFNTASLEIFKNNFSLMENVINCYRIVNSNITNNLGNIVDISVSEFSNISENYKTFDKTQIFQKTQQFSNNQIEQRIKKLIEFIKENQDTQIWKTNLFPIDFLSLSHNKGEAKEKILEQLNEKNTNYLNRLWRILNG